jgi:hypothetical protein
LILTILGEANGRPTLHNFKPIIILAILDDNKKIKQVK